MKRKTIQFKVNGEVKAELADNLYLNQIDEHCFALASKFNVNVDDVSTDIVETEVLISEFDVTVNGILNFKDVNFESMTGISCTVEFGSDEHLDAILDGIKLEEFLHLT